jgi:hypothetical protein
LEFWGRKVVYSSKFSLLAILLPLFLVSIAEADDSCSRPMKACDNDGLNCKMQIQCSKFGFYVDLPLGWSARAEVSENLAAHLESPHSKKTAQSEGTGSNCPIATAVAVDINELHIAMNGSQSWAVYDSANEKIENYDFDLPKAFWFKIFKAAGLTKGKYNIEVVNQRVRVKVKQSGALLDVPLHDSEAAWNAAQVSLAEILFQVSKDKPIMRARQALYYMPQTLKTFPGRPPPEDIKFVPTRVYFVNCTSVDETVGNKVYPKKFQAITDEVGCVSKSGFCKELPSFNQVFKSLSPRQCYSVESASEMKCEDPFAERLTPTKESGRSASSPVLLSQESTQSLIQAGAMAASMGAQ